MIEMEKAGVDRIFELFFLIVRIGDTAPLVDATAAIDGLGLEEQGIGDRRLASHLMPYQCNGANIVRFVAAHQYAPWGVLWRHVCNVPVDENCSRRRKAVSGSRCRRAS